MIKNIDTQAGTWYTFNVTQPCTISETIEGETATLLSLSAGGTGIFFASGDTITIDTEGKYRILPTKAPAAPRNGGGESPVAVDQIYTPESTNPQSGTAVADGAAMTVFRSILFNYAFAVPTWQQFVQLNPTYTTDKIVIISSCLGVPGSLTLPNADYVYIRRQSPFASNSQPNQFPGSELNRLTAENAKCVWVELFSANVAPKPGEIVAPRVVFYAPNNMNVLNYALGWQYEQNPAVKKTNVIEYVFPYQTNSISFGKQGWFTADFMRDNFPREWRIFLPSILGGISVFTDHPQAPPLSKESALYLLNYVRKSAFSSSVPYPISMALAADYFDENGELIDEELLEKVESMKAHYSISFVKSSYYL